MPICVELYVYEDEQYVLRDFSVSEYGDPIWLTANEGSYMRVSGDLLYIERVIRDPLNDMIEIYCEYMDEVEAKIP